jgi:hypothetical protein
LQARREGVATAIKKGVQLMSKLPWKPILAWILAAFFVF